MTEGLCAKHCIRVASYAILVTVDACLNCRTKNVLHDIERVAAKDSYWTAASHNRREDRM